MQSLSLKEKIELTIRRVRDWIKTYGEDGVYIAFSGGKDSTVLLDIVRKEYPDIKAVFFDTGLEYPEIREFVKTFDNVEWIKPKMNFRQVIEKYGYPFISKEVSESVYGAKRYLKSLETEGGGQVYRYEFNKLCGQNYWKKSVGGYSKSGKYGTVHKVSSSEDKNDSGDLWETQQTDNGEYP